MTTKTIARQLVSTAALAVCASASAQSTVTLYGTVDAGLTYTTNQQVTNADGSVITEGADALRRLVSQVTRPVRWDSCMAALRELIGEVNIEELSISYTAVATDLDREREVWLTKGPLFDAIRASIAIPTLFRPYVHDGRRLVDGALLNPLPVLPLMREDADYVIAVSVDGAAEMQKPPEKDVTVTTDEGYTAKLGRLIGRVLPSSDGKPKLRDPGAFDLMTQAMDLMQANLSRLRLAAYQPDVLIEIPRNVSTVYEFYRARELIELGRERTARALDAWHPRMLTR